MTRSQLDPMPEYFDRYINLADDVSVLEALKISLDELKNAPVDQWKSLGDKVYAPGKWTIKDILQHLIDTERVFAYRALSFARGEREVKPFDEELYGQNAQTARRSFEDMMQEAITLRLSTLQLFESFTEEMLDKTGKSFKGEYSVRAIGYIFAGHHRWHVNIINERYLPLI